MDATLVHTHTPTQPDPIGAVDSTCRVVDASLPSLRDAMMYRMNAEQFLAMIDAGIFREEDRVGLWEGWVYEKMAKTQAHATSGNKTFLAIVRALPPGWFPGAENPVRLSDDKVPLPDLVILRGVPDDYRVRRPEVRDVGLIVEIALSSLRDDLGPKLVGYATAGMQNYWVVDLAGECIRAFSTPDPGEGIYGLAGEYHRGESVPLRLDGAEPVFLAVDDMLPLPAE